MQGRKCQYYLLIYWISRKYIVDNHVRCMLVARLKTTILIWNMLHMHAPRAHTIILRNPHTYSLDWINRDICQDKFFLDHYRAFAHDVTTAMLVFQFKIILIRFFYQEHQHGRHGFCWVGNECTPCPQNPKIIDWNNVLLEFACPSTKLNAKMRKMLTGCMY
jgi:hypothetical protein